MTKKQLQQAHKLNDWLTEPTTQAVLAYLARNCRFTGKSAGDATAIIRNDGCTSGWFAAIEEIEDLAHIASEPPVVRMSYGDQIENNRPKNPNEQ